MFLPLIRSFQGEQSLDCINESVMAEVSAAQYQIQSLKEKYLKDELDDQLSKFDVSG